MTRDDARDDPQAPHRGDAMRKILVLLLLILAIGFIAVVARTESTRPTVGTAVGD